MRVTPAAYSNVAFDAVNVATVGVTPGASSWPPAPHPK